MEEELTQMEAFVFSLTWSRIADLFERLELCTVFSLYSCKNI